MADTASKLLHLSADIVSAYVSNNPVPPGEVAGLIRQVHASVLSVASGVALPSAQPAKPEDLVPAVAIKRSVTDDHIVCLEDGLKFKSLKRHLRARYGLSPEQYRAKWGLPVTYPMVAPAYAKSRSDLAKAIGLGRPGNAAPAAQAGAGQDNAPATAPVRAAARSARRDPTKRLAS